LLKAPSSKEIAAGPAYFRPISKKRIFVITITSRAQRRSSSPRKIEGMKAVHVYQSKYSPRSLGKISEESRRNPRGERAAVFLTFDFQGGEDVSRTRMAFSITKCGARVDTDHTMRSTGCCGF
jgi:hypothetical protein